MTIDDFGLLMSVSDCIANPQFFNPAVKDHRRFFISNSAARGNVRQLQPFFGTSIARACRMTPDELKNRTKAFAVEILEFAKGLPKDPVTTVVTQQLIRSATGLAANYRAACRAKSRADFISKLGTTEEEADETEYWLTILVEKGTVRQDQVASLLDEVDELVRIIVASIKTARRNGKRK